MVQDTDIESLVKKVTEQVMRRMEAPKKTCPESVAPSIPSSEGVLVVLAGDCGDVDAVLDQVRCICAEASGATIVLANGAEALFPSSRISVAAPGATIITESDGPDVLNLLKGASVVFIPLLDLASASKIADTVTDTLPVKLAVFAALQGKTVVAARDGIPSACIPLEQVPDGARKRLEGMLGGLEELGLTLVDLADIAGGKKVSLVCAQGKGEECLACGLCVINNADSVRGILAAGADRIGAAAGTRIEDKEIAKTIDHTLLKPDATTDQIRKLCEEAVQYGFASVCINPANVKQAADLVKGSNVKVTTVIGFPLGATTPTTKAIETRDAIANGANEIDMVINVGALKSGDDDLVRRDIEAVVEAAQSQAIVKVILETALLSKDEKVRGCLLAKMAGADFVKTSTGFGPSGATVEDIALMRATVGPDMGIKASGGIRDTETAKAMIAAGATRIGASASVAITKGAEGGEGY